MDVEMIYYILISIFSIITNDENMTIKQLYKNEARKSVIDFLSCNVNYLPIREFKSFIM